MNKQQLVDMQSNWQREIAQQQVLPTYQTIDGLVCALLVGSTARNLQGTLSDVDLVMYWKNIPTEEQRIQCIEQATGVISEIGDSSEGETDPALQSQAEVFYLYGDRNSGVKVDVTHKTTESAEWLIDSVVNHCDTKRIKLAIMHSLRHSITLHGDSWMAARLEQIGQQMPLALAHKLIDDNIRFEPVWVFDKFVERPDPVLYHHYRLHNIDRMLMTLSAVNRMYMQMGFKHLHAFLDELKLYPENLSQDIVQILESDPSIAKPIMTRLGDAIYDLVEQEFPQIDIQESREFFHYARPKHDISPLETIQTNVSKSRQAVPKFNNQSNQKLK